MGLLTGKVAIVTGAGKGIGAGEALALAKEGATVTVVSRTLSDVSATAEMILSAGGKAHALQCDVRNSAEVKHVVEVTARNFGGIDILVNNAQIMPPQHPFETWTEQEMRDTWESGTLGTWLFMMECFPLMKEKGGKIINTCSAAGHGRILGFVGYSSAKEGIRSITRSAAREWGKYKINVNAISPAAMRVSRAGAYDTEAKRDVIFDTLTVAIRRFGDAERDIGRTVVFLSGPDSDYITGCTIGVDGGSAMI